MPKLHTGDKIPNFTFDTTFEKEKSFYDELTAPTYLWFLRYYGCTVCQVDIYDLQQRYAEFVKKGAKVMIVLQSKQSVVADAFLPDQLPFDIICDPEMKLYQDFEILPAKSKLGLASTGLLTKLKRSKDLGFQHGEYEGNEQQLPALFLIDTDGTVRSAHYAKNITDIPSIDEMLKQL